MPGKSRGGHKHVVRRKKGKITRDFSLTGTQQQAVAQDDKSVSQAVSPSAKVLKPRSTLSSVVQHPYITTELRRIAILAGVMLVIMVVLYLAIS